MKLPSVYEPAKYEADIYGLWEQGRVFEPKNRGSDDYFSLVLPPPNANGDLHIGHALINAIQDTLVRYYRLRGRAVLYVPGADHAGFETWVVYEKKLNAEGKSRFDYSREQLYKQVWDFVDLNRHNFESQLRALGASLDWNRFTFTLDTKVVDRAYKTFKEMWDDGLIYRGKRIVNYCTFHGTSFSDIEVVHEEEKTKLWHIAYPLADGEGEIVVATTRPETMLGDTAVAVNPDDKRYKKLVGRKVKLPLSERQIPIVADKMVDPKFGSGAVKVTPGHDPNDFELAERHTLPVIELINTEGKMTGEAPVQFRGLTVTEARRAVVESLEKAGRLRDTQDYTHSVGKCYKCGTTIEPLVREQWFVKMRPLADPAIKSLKAGKIKFYPDSKMTQTISYLTEVRDWNISRQIAWGIPIPAFQNIDDPSDWIFDTRVGQETINANGKNYRRDPDVFDTWFSSGQWPYVTLDYPGNDFDKYYPLSLMETGGEILYQWVARMIMLGLYATGTVPFKTVYIHGYVLAEDGAKMSKSLGNVVSPTELIRQYGSDALRMGLLTGRRPGVNQGYHPSKIKAGRNFANKLWNIARFIEANAKSGEPLSLKTPADHWIASRLNATTTQIAEALENYRLSEAFEALYGFVWRDLADWYIEASKLSPNGPLLAHALEASLKLAHPFAPFVTETIWQTLGWQKGGLLATAGWPTPIEYDTGHAADFEAVAQLISQARQLSRALGESQPVLLFSDDKLIAANSDLIARLAGLEAVRPERPTKGRGLKLTATGRSVWLDVDKAKISKHVGALDSQKTEAAGVIKRLSSRLGNKNYVSKAPPELVQQTRQQLEEQQQKLAELDEEIAGFKDSAA